MEHITLLVGVVIITALVFDFTNGFHDTANAMATTISTGAMAPKAAVAMSAVLNLAGALLSVQVAKTISGGIIDEKAGVRPEVIFAALVGAIIWNLLTWLLGLPSSSSHALFGGLIGATLASAGWAGINGDAIAMKILIPALASPVVAGVAALLATRLTYRVGRAAGAAATSKGYRAGQIASAALVSLAHGTSDAQKTMGVITLALVTAGLAAPHSDPPLWVILAAATAMALGTYLGGWRIIRTMGKKLTDVEPPQGFAAQTGAAVTILASSHLGFALSTTHVVSGAVTGAGVGRKGAVVRWGVAGRMVASWMVTLPAAGLVAAAATVVAEQGNWGVGVVGLAGIAVAAGSRVVSQRRRVDHTNVNTLEEEVEENLVTVPEQGAEPAFSAFGGDLPAAAPGTAIEPASAVPPPAGPARV